MQGSPDAIYRDSENIKKIPGYLEEVQGSPEAVSRDFENNDILEDSTDTLG